MLTMEQKKALVAEGKKELAKYSLVGVIPLSGIPDRLVQSSRNKLRPTVRFLTGKKNILVRILDSSEKTKHLSKEITATSAIILSNEDPFELYKKFKSNRIKLAAKPRQIAPEDINIEAGDTTIQPGQAVTELKQAGIDVQIQKGKVVIAKDKVLVKKGTSITAAVAKALKTLDIMPFTASIEPSVLFSGGMMFRRDILGIDAESTMKDVISGFSTALTLSFAANIVNQYTIKTMVEKAYRTAMGVGVELKTELEPGITEKLMANASMAAAALNAMVPEATATPAAEEPKKE